MTATQFAAHVAELAKTITEYVWGETGDNGKCDCIGLIIGALERNGVNWTGTNGTNYAARNEMRYMTPLEDASVLRVGMVVYKSKMPGQSGYDLPEKYTNGGDLNDYYHIGTVTHVEPLEITHCTSNGPIKRDNSAKGWHWYGELNKVEPTGADAGENSDTEWRTMYVTGGKLALRNGPGKTYQALVWIPDGEMVQCTGEGEWVQVKWGKYAGWCMGEYLHTGRANNAENVTVTMDRETAEYLLEALSKAL